MAVEPVATGDQLDRLREFFNTGGGARDVAQRVLPHLPHVTLIEINPFRTSRPRSLKPDTQHIGFLAMTLQVTDELRIRFNWDLDVTETSMSGTCINTSRDLGAILVQDVSVGMPGGAVSNSVVMRCWKNLLVRLHEQARTCVRLRYG